MPKTYPLKRKLSQEMLFQIKLNQGDPSILLVRNSGVQKYEITKKILTHSSHRMHYIQTLLTSKLEHTCTLIWKARTQLPVRKMERESVTCCECFGASSARVQTSLAGTTVSQALRSKRAPLHLTVVPCPSWLHNNAKWSNT